MTLVVDEVFVLKDEVLAVVGERLLEVVLCDVEVGMLMRVIGIWLVPGTVSENSVNVLAIYHYSLGAAFRGVR